MNLSEYEMKQTPKKVKNFASMFMKKVGICTKMLTKPVVETITMEQKESAERTLKKLIDMRARVRKLNQGNDEPLTDAEKFNFDTDTTDMDMEEEDMEEDMKEEKQEEEELEEEEDDEDKEIQVTKDEDKEIHKRVQEVKEDIRNKGPGSIEMMTVGPEFWSALRELKLRKCDISEGQNILEAAIRKQKHFVSHAGRFEMLRLSEVSVPQESGGDVYERFCSACDMNVPLKDWLSHVKTQFHQIQYKTKVTLLGFCWFKEPNRNVHDPSECDECLRRMQVNRNYTDKYEDIKA